MSGRCWLCICFVFAVVQSTVAAADTTKKHDNDVAQYHSTASVRPGSLNQETKPKRLFARTHYLSAQRQARRPKSDPVAAASIPVRRCVGLMESCSGRTPCCEPCASCHCRLFNTICHCWRLGSCPKKT